MTLQKGLIPVLFIFVGLIFQNCAPAAPPSSEDLSSEGIYQPPTAQQVDPTASPTPMPGPTSTPVPVAQTYSWNVGPWSLCVSSRRTRSVTCVDQNGSLALASNCTDPKPISSSACLVKPIYNCHVIYSGTSCGYGCLTSTSLFYSTQATDPSKCNANPMLVPGTDIGKDYSQRTIARPFTYCVVTRALNFVPGGTGESQCQ